MNRPTLRQLEYAVAVDDLRNFGRAAADLHVSQPGLSAQIAELERRLGVALFERSRTATVPTAAGEEVLARARRILSEVDDLARAVEAHRGTVAGPFRVGAIPTIAPYLLPTVVHQLRRLWPDVELVLSELRTSELVTAIEDGRVDVGILATPVDTGSLHVSDLVVEKFVLVVAEHHPLADRPSVSVADLAEVEMLLLEDGHCLREHVLAVCHLGGATRQRSVHHTGLSVLVQMVANGSATTLLPVSAVPVEVRPGSGLATVPLRDHVVGRTISMVWRRTDPRAAFYEQCIPRVTSAVAASVGAGA